ncbi:12299_t:CDS:2 [Racocetra fulgida]|uniref:12299_t:CDS:1 n=1 Tax=Racocetra fulgida TaxID=60492 RepID=A0A9N8Z1D0_9GLOM|nr:12299_t:CDS:2 [Racocetra fulgida]
MKRFLSVKKIETPNCKKKQDKRKTNDDIVNTCKQLIKQQNEYSYEQQRSILSVHKNASQSIDIVKKYVAETGKHISVETIQNTLKRYGYKAKVKPKKPAISENTRLKHLVFAKKHLKWTVDDWRKVVFFNENKLEPDYVSQTKKFEDNKGYRIILAKDLFGTLLEHDLDFKDSPYSADLNPIENA